MRFSRRSASCGPALNVYVDPLYRKDSDIVDGSSGATAPSFACWPGERSLGANEPSPEKLLKSPPMVSQGVRLAPSSTLKPRSIRFRFGIERTDGLANVSYLGTSPCWPSSIWVAQSRIAQPRRMALHKVIIEGFNPS